MTVTTETDTARRRRDRLHAAFEEEQLRALRVGSFARAVSIVIISIWLTIQQPLGEAVYYLALMPGFILFGWVPYLLRRAGRDWWWPAYVFPALDMFLLVVVVLLPNPLNPIAIPPALFLRFGNEIYFFILIASSVFYYAPRVVIWSGVCAALAWATGAVWIITRPGVEMFDPSVFDTAATSAQQIAYYMRPDIVIGNSLVAQGLLFLLVAGTLAVAVSRLRSLAWRHAHAERQRSNLARHFSPNMVDELADTDQPLGAARGQNVAVMFVDIVDFTGLAENQPPEQVFVLLRELLAMMASRVFHHNGTLDKYLGDGIMATFGTPRVSDQDAANALACGRDILVDFAAFAAKHPHLPPVSVGVGIHYGPVVLGNVGDARRLEFAVIGDTVNVASRLERLTREYDAGLAISADAVDVVDPGAAPLRAELHEIDPQSVRGRREPLRVWMMDRP